MNLDLVSFFPDCTVFFDLLFLYFPFVLIAVYNAPAGQSVDSWGLACLIWEVFNPERLTDSSQLTAKANLDRLPKQLQREYRRLLSTRIPLTTASGSGPHRRPSHFSMFLKSGFFNNDYISTLLFLEEIQLKDKQEKAEFLIGLGERAAGMFPDDICRYKVGGCPILFLHLFTLTGAHSQLQGRYAGRKYERGANFLLVLLFISSPLL